MKRSVITVLSLLLVLPLAASAQQWTAEQLEVWQVELDVWAMDMAGDKTWIDRYVHDDLLGWPNASPIPIGKESVAKWYGFEDPEASVPVFELTPVGIVVHGDVAVVHYFVDLGEIDSKGERHRRRGSWTDFLVKDNGSWKYIAWRGGLFEEDEN